MGIFGGTHGDGAAQALDQIDDYLFESQFEDFLCEDLEYVQAPFAPRQPALNKDESF